MGISILELVLCELREAGFLADVSFPGQKYPLITQPVAAVHIEQVDRANLAVTVEVSIICPASLGGTQCEVEALRATEVLRWAGATCIQNGCNYDGLAQVYVVSILATFICVTDAQNCTMGPGFRIYLNDVYIPYVQDFQVELTQEVEPQYAMGEDEPVGVGSGKRLWSLRLEELVPTGSDDEETLEGAFRLTFKSDTESEEYFDCRWTRVYRQFTRHGMKRIREGFSLRRTVIVSGNNGL